MTSSQPVRVRRTCTCTCTCRKTERKKVGAIVTVSADFRERRNPNKTTPKNWVLFCTWNLKKHARKANRGYSYEQRDKRRLALLSWNWGVWGLKEYKWQRFFLGWFVGFIVPVQAIFVLPWLRCFTSPYNISFYLSLSPSKLGRQSCWVATLLIWVSCYERQKRKGTTSEIQMRKKILELLDKDW